MTDGVQSRMAEPWSTTPRLLAETLDAAGLPLVSGGTDNHLMLVDVTAVGLGGKKAEAVLDDCGITVNMNMIPFDTRKPMDPSGHPHRYPGADDSWDGNRGDEADRRLDSSSALRCRRCIGARDDSRGGSRNV